MFPVLFEIGPVTVYTYGFFVAAGALAAIVFARSHARRWGMNPDRITDLCFFLVIAAIMGSRLFYVAIN
ncbi:MAG: prolipoprotein diacylglyceryl transferase, partial [Desulfobacterales bacterium]|nr:prolipoprotein diacylglyceryl transferase [Desulfobacterales bacterium]